MPAGLNYTAQLRTWLLRHPDVTAAALAGMLHTSRRTVEGWLAGKNCHPLTARHVIEPFLSKQGKRK